MTIKDKLIVNRLTVAFILFCVILVSFAPAVFLGDDTWTVIPFFLAGLLALWLVYSYILKKKLLTDGTVTAANKDFITNFMWDFKPNSQAKIFFHAYGMTVALIMLFTLITSLIFSQELTVDIALSPLGGILFIGFFITSYFIVKKKLK